MPKPSSAIIKIFLLLTLAFNYTLSSITFDRDLEVSDDTLRQVSENYQSLRRRQIFQKTVQDVSINSKPSPMSKSMPKSKLIPQPKSTKFDSCTKLVANEIGWHNWLQDINTNTPIFRPKTDNELITIVNAAKKNKVRDF
jgi:hypothetical protein